MNYFVGIKFDKGNKYYSFSTDNAELLPGDKVVVETIRGLELGEVTTKPLSVEFYKSDLELKPIIKLADQHDLKQFELNKTLAEQAKTVFVEEVENLKLDMHLVDCVYTLDASKAIFSYVSDDRVDFRELLKNLAPRLHCRVELRQIGPRDKAKIYGGIGICGRPICCSLFLNEFDGISINRAKNQMLAINIPKLSGQCGKLMCCLKFEDEAYTALKAEFPDTGTKLKYNDSVYFVSSYNVISKIVKCSNSETEIFIPLDAVKKGIEAFNKGTKTNK
jgi:cell fate regulator YaaT (PSP1 superfamily)